MSRFFSTTLGSNLCGQLGKANVPIYLHILKELLIFPRISSTEQQIMELAKITSRGQTTIPKRIREAFDLREGDVISFELEGDHLLVQKLLSGRDEYLQGIGGGLSEWDSPEDENVWRDL